MTISNTEEVQRGRASIRHLDADGYVGTVLPLRKISERCQNLNSGQAVWYYYTRTSQLTIHQRDSPRCREKISQIMGSVVKTSQLIGPIINETQRQISHAMRLVQTLAYSRASDAQKKTYEVFQSMPLITYSWESLETVFTRYFDAKAKRERKSLEELTEGLEIPTSGLSRIFRKVKIEPMYGSRERKKLTSEEKETLRRVFPLHIPAPDIAYFMGLSYPRVSNFFHSIGKRPRQKDWTKYLGPIRKNRLASQIYWADDLKSSSRRKEFSKEEIAGLLDTTPEIVGYAREHRKTIEPKIIDILKKIYPRRDVRKPYIKVA